MSAARLRYEPLVKLASGGMATVYVGALRSDLAFRQLVAIKRPHPHLVEDPELREELLVEARLASRIHHANVVDVRDVEVVGESVQLVMDYVEGASLSELILVGAKAGPRIPSGVAVRIALDACAGLHAAHELGIVHRDVSPQNILVGLDGVARVVDFGVAKQALSNKPRTTTGTLKGKIGYLAPEYVRGKPVDRRADVFALGVVLWEALAHKRLFRASNEAEALERVLREEAPAVSAFTKDLGETLDAAIAKALQKAPEERWPSALDFGDALEQAARGAGLVATRAEVAKAVLAAVGDEITARRTRVSEAIAALDKGEAAPSEPRETKLAVAPGGARRWARPSAIVLVASVTATAAFGLAASRSPSVPTVARSASASTQRDPAPPAELAVHATPVLPSESASATPSARAVGTAAASVVPQPRRGPRPLPPNPYR